MMTATILGLLAVVALLAFSCGYLGAKAALEAEPWQRLPFEGETELVGDPATLRKAIVEVGERHDSVPPRS
jgi:hypothetical protein